MDRQTDNRTIAPAHPCPCGSGIRFDDCCGPLLDGTRPASTAEALMRSRYTGYLLRRERYLLETWCGETRPERIEFADSTRWLGLGVLGRRGGMKDDVEGSVEFAALFVEEGRIGELHETSRFVRGQGTWCYLDGDVRQRQIQVGRNEPCPCGSGRKFKRCHGG